MPPGVLPRTQRTRQAPHSSLGRERSAGAVQLKRRSACTRSLSRRRLSRSLRSRFLAPRRRCRSIPRRPDARATAATFFPQLGHAEARAPEAQHVVRHVPHRSVGRRHAHHDRALLWTRHASHDRHQPASAGRLGSQLPRRGPSRQGDALRIASAGGPRISSRRPPIATPSATSGRGACRRESHPTRRFPAATSSSTPIPSFASAAIFVLPSLSRKREEHVLPDAIRRAQRAASRAPRHACS